MIAYYNEIDPFKAEVIREAIKAGAIAPGEVDERSIADVRATDLVGYTQCHFFAGGGFWSLALRQAGWPDEREVWTGSCPCPSFSAAGKGAGFADPRHLWPEWARLIRERRPASLFGEQVAAAIGHGWLDLVSTDLEAEGYAVAAAVLGAHSVGAPHIRQRLYFVAHTEERGSGAGLCDREPGSQRWSVAPDHRCAGSLDHAAGSRRDGQIEGAEGDSRDGERLRLPGEGRGDGLLEIPSGDRLESGSTSITGRQGGATLAEHRSKSGLLGDAGCAGDEPGRESGHLGREGRAAFPEHGGQSFRPGPLNGFWRDADWIGCRDGKWRPVKPGTFPLAYGYPARVGLLRLAGDAICVPAARAFIEAYIDAEIHNKIKI